MARSYSSSWWSAQATHRCDGKRVPDDQMQPCWRCMGCWAHNDPFQRMPARQVPASHRLHRWKHAENENRLFHSQEARSINHEPYPASKRYPEY